MSRWFHNGEPADHIEVDERGFQYGDGLFETIAVRNGEPRLWNYHMERLATGCERLRMCVPEQRDLRRQLDDAVKDYAPNSSRCLAKLIVSSGVSQRGYGRKTPTDTEVYVGIFESTPVREKYYRDGVDTILCETRLALHSVTAGIKTLNRLEQVLARSECVAHSAFEGFTLDADERVICGTMSNVFIVAEKSVTTPSLARCGVEGVMRRHTIATLKENGVAVTVRDVSRAEFLNSDEVFLSNSQFGILPVRRCGEKVWRSSELTKHIMAMMGVAGIAECVV